MGGAASDDITFFGLIFFWEGTGNSMGERACGRCASHFGLGTIPRTLKTI